MKSLILLLLLLSQQGLAGGPLYVAGAGDFQPGLAGTPVTWFNGQITYYTDPGGLGPLLSNSQADQLVADAFARWTSVATAAIDATHAGHLDEDVNGSNFYVVDGSLSVPADIQADSGRPVAIVYDADGRVLDALLGPGSGAAEMCSTNSVYAAIDKIGDDAHFVHALIVLNGNCARTQAQLRILRYRLTRAIGQILGLDYSQLNDNVVWGSPSPVLDDYTGFPLMHPLGVLCNESGCQADADLPRMDDRAAVSRLYPVTGSNGDNYPGKQVFAERTARISGSVRFRPWRGAAGQGMQGVNVVARLVDPMTGRVSRRYAASSVSGFLFRGNAGNSITGFTDGSGKRFDRFGSGDTALEGYFDLSGLEIPDGFHEAIFELSAEPLNSLYSESSSVGPYKKGQVTPSGLFSPLRVTVSRGGELTQDIVMQDSASNPTDDFEPNSFSSPSAVPTAGDWLGSLSGYGDVDYTYFYCRPNRSFTFSVRAQDEEGTATTTKALPVLGAWGESDGENVPGAFERYFNSSQTATTRLQVSVLSGSECKLGIADARGDGRPDYRYEARLLYADDIAPSRAGVNGGTTINLSGVGFTPGIQVFVASTPVAATVMGADRIVFNSPSLPDGAYSIVVRDTASGATSQMDNVLLIGSADARLVLVSGGNPQVPVGTQAPSPIRVRVVDANTGTPIAGATVNFSVPATASIVGCSSLPCSLLSDQSGAVSALVQVKAAGASVITASLPNGNSVQTTVNGVSSPLEITLDQPTIYVSSGASASLNVSAVVVANGVAAAGRTVNFLLNSGTAAITPSSAVTGSTGVASTTVSVSQITTDANISACVAPNNSPCRTLLIRPVAASGLAVQRVSGDQQTISVGGVFSPVRVRVVNSSGNPVSGASLTFQSDVYRAQTASRRIQRGELVITINDEPVVLATSSSSVITDAAGIASFQPIGDQYQPVHVVIRAIAGQSEVGLTLNSIWADSLNNVALPGAADSSSVAAILTPIPAPRRSAPKPATLAPTVHTPAQTRASQRIQLKRAEIEASATSRIVVRVLDGEDQPVAGATVSFFVDVFSPAEGSALLHTVSAHTESDSNGTATLHLDDVWQEPVRLIVSAFAEEAELNFTLPSRRAQRLRRTSSSAVPSSVTSSGGNQPTRLRSCTKAGCSGVSAPSDPRQGSTASSTGPSVAAGK